jgi:hypothetical protein
MAVWSGEDSRISFLPTNVFVMCIKPIAQVTVFFFWLYTKRKLKKTKGAIIVSFEIFNSQNSTKF